MSHCFAALFISSSLNGALATIREQSEKLRGKDHRVARGPFLFLPLRPYAVSPTLPN